MSASVCQLRAHWNPATLNQDPVACPASLTDICCYQSAESTDTSTYPLLRKHTPPCHLTPDQMQILPSKCLGKCKEGPVIRAKVDSSAIRGGPAAQAPPCEVFKRVAPSQVCAALGVLNMGAALA